VMGDWGLGPIPNPQSPIPNPQSPNYVLLNKIIIKNNNLILKNNLLLVLLNHFLFYFHNYFNLNLKYIINYKHMDNTGKKLNDTEKNDENEDIKKDEKKSNIVQIGEIGLKGFEKYLDYRNKKDDNERDVKLKELEIQERIMKEKLEFYQMRIKELEEKDKKKEKEEEDKKNKLKDGTKEWNEKEKKLIEKFLNEIDFNYIKNILEKKDLTIIKENTFEHEFSRIFTEGLKDNEKLKEKHNSIFRSIKNNIKEIQSLNFLIAGRSGVGKTALTNAILKFNKAIEGENIDSQTSAITAYSNPTVVPGIVIYDTIGVEATSNDRNIEKIKKGIKETFDQNLNNPEGHFMVYYTALKMNPEIIELKRGKSSLLKT